MHYKTTLGTPRHFLQNNEALSVVPDRLLNTPRRGNSGKVVSGDGRTPRLGVVVWSHQGFTSAT